jgi:hypothetical protein
VLEVGAESVTLKIDPAEGGADAAATEPVPGMSRIGGALLGLGSVFPIGISKIGVGGKDSLDVNEATGPLELPPGSALGPESDPEPEPDPGPVTSLG